MVWLGVTLGCLAILMLQHVTGGVWGTVIRRQLEAGTRTLPLMAVLFIPIFSGMPHLYVWARPLDTIADSTAQAPAGRYSDLSDSARLHDSRRHLFHHLGCAGLIS